VLIDLGLQTIAVRESSKDTNDTSRIAGSLFWIKVIWGGFTLFVCSLLFSYSNFSAEIKTGFKIATAGYFFLALASVPATVFQSRLKLHFSVLSEIAGQAAFLILTAIIFFFSPFRSHLLYFFLGANIASSFIILLVGLFFVSRMVKIEFTVNLETSKRLLKNTLPLTVVILLSQLHFKGDSLMLSIMKSETDVGIYGIAYRFFEAAIIFPAIMTAVFFPVLSRYHSDNENMNKVAGNYFNILAVSGIISAALLFFLSSQLILLVGGKGFEQAIFPLRVLGFALLFSFLNSVFANIVIAKNHQKAILYISIYGVSLNIILNAIFIPYYSYNACAVITVVSEFFGMTFMGYLAHRASGFNPFVRNYLWKIQKISP
jgi:O-antigen/teichoic acid export membrane protein